MRVLHQESNCRSTSDQSGETLPENGQSALSQTPVCAPSIALGSSMSFPINDGRFPDDLKLTLFAETASMKDLAIFAKTNRNARQLVPYAIDLRFLRLLRSYFTMEGALIVRDFMRSHGVMIAGSEGYRFARGYRKAVKPDEEDWEPNNINFYTARGVSDSKYLQALVALIVSLGGSYKHPEEVADDAERFNHAFRKATNSITHLKLRGKQIIVHESTGRRAAVAVLDSWTICTAVITADFVLVFYPGYFFEDVATLQGLEESFPGTEPLIAKYAKRGVVHVDPPFSRVKSYCLADWATVAESSKVCVLPMNSNLWGAIPPEFAGRFRWRATIHCYDYHCPVHNRGERRKSLLEELSELSGSS
ncbi:hypothetical protein AURDEDRAFT_122120 [Auricularia subglabra TFB-10046 SS5]|nr:hypothetical protein AURDEDRAFT_122120 [Auricularia subglabra TFB-10046 SS5]